jgi:platelet-activating factor acetylhydrolase IB subunit alpha
MKLEGHDNWVRDGALMANGQYVISVSDDQSMRIWQLETGKCLRTYPNIHKTMVSAITLASPLLATGSEQGEIKLWKCE